MIQSQINRLLALIEGWLQGNPIFGALTVAAGVAVLGEALHRLFRFYVLQLIQRIAKRSSTRWDDAFLQARLPQRLAWAVPLVFWYYGALLVPGVPTDLVDLVRRVLLATLIVVLVRAFSAVLDGFHQIYSGLPRAKERPIKGFLQVANILAHLAGLVLVIAALMSEDPLFFLGGMGAFAAVLLLVFRDSLLSLVAGIQITTNDLIRVGDWIEMPQFDADGDVVDIALNFVKVQNFDNTFTVIPTHKFLEHSFRNWRGMEESGGRRIKRAFNIDQGTIRFLTDDEVDRFGEWELLREYVARKRVEIEAHNRAHQPADGVRVPARRRLTNVGVLRAYLVEYLRRHPDLRKDSTLLVRQLAPGPNGLPIEIYVFVSDTRWIEYEGIQGDVFDHVLTMVPQFDLGVFQSPSGSDFAAFARGKATA